MALEDLWERLALASPEQEKYYGLMDDEGAHPFMHPVFSEEEEEACGGGSDSGTGGMSGLSAVGPGVGVGPGRIGWQGVPMKGVAAAAEGGSSSLVAWQ